MLWNLHNRSMPWAIVNIRGVRGCDVPTNMVAQHVSLAAQSQNQVDGNYSPSGYCNPIVCTHPQAVYQQK